MPKMPATEKMTAGQTRAADGFGAVGQMPDHHGVDDTHRHPGEFGENQWKCEAQHDAGRRPEPHFY